MNSKSIVCIEWFITHIYLQSFKSNERWRCQVMVWVSFTTLNAVSMMCEFTVCLSHCDFPSFLIPLDVSYLLLSVNVTWYILQCITEQWHWKIHCTQQFREANIFKHSDIFLIFPFAFCLFAFPYQNNFLMKFESGLHRIYLLVDLAEQKLLQLCG